MLELEREPEPELERDPVLELELEREPEPERVARLAAPMIDTALAYPEVCENGVGQAILSKNVVAADDERVGRVSGGRRPARGDTA